MSDIYTPNTTGGEAGEFIHDGLEEIQGQVQSSRPNGPSNLLPAQEYEELVDHEGNSYTVPKKIEYPVDQDAPFISFDQYEAQDREKFDHATTIVIATDEHALDLLNQINEQKQEIVNIMGDLFDSINTSSPYPAPDQRLISPTLNLDYFDADGRGPFGDDEPLFNAPVINDELGNKVSFISGITTFTYPPTCTVPNSWLSSDITGGQVDGDGNVISPGRSDCTPDLDCCLVGVKAPIYPDILEAYIYPVLENGDIDAEFYTIGAKYIELNDNKVGMGETSFTYGDPGGYTGFKDAVISYNSPLGYYYFWVDLQAFNSSAYDEIVSRVSDIEYFRQELKEFISDSKVGTNNLRDIRHGHQVDLWYGLLSRNSGGLNYDKALDTLEDGDVSGIIQNYDS